MRRRDSGCDWLAGVHIPPRLPVDDQSRQYARRIGSGIDADAVGPLLDLTADRVPVDDHEAVIGVVGEERLADPSQVRLGLLSKLDARTNSGVHEKVVAEA